MLTLIYRPEREEFPRQGGRYIENYLLNPGINTYENRAERVLNEYLLTDEGKGYLKTTVLEVVENASQPAVKEFVMEPNVQILEEDNEETQENSEKDSAKAKRTRKKTAEE